MTKKINIQLIIHILFCILLTFWFYRNSHIRPIAVGHPYKEIFSALFLLSILYVNLLILIPKIYYRNNLSIYLIISLIIICLSGIAEMWLVKSDVDICARNFPKDDYRLYFFHTTMIVILRNGGFYLCFTMLGIYQSIKKNAFKEKIAVSKKEGILSFLRCNNKELVLNVDRIIYFQQDGNRTTIHTTHGNSFLVYNSLSDIEKYNEAFVRINRDTLVNYNKIASFTHDHLVIKQSKNGKFLSIYFYKMYGSSIYAFFQNAVPHLEKKNALTAPKKDKIVNITSRKHDERNKFGNIKTKILEAIRQNPGINAIKLHEVLQQTTSLRTTRRRIKELMDSGLIKFQGSVKTGGYHIV